MMSASGGCCCKNSLEIAADRRGRIAAIERFTVGFPVAILLTDRDRSACATHLIRVIRE